MIHLRVGSYTILFCPVIRERTTKVLHALHAFATPQAEPFLTVHMLKEIKEALLAGCAFACSSRRLT